MYCKCLFSIIPEESTGFKIFVKYNKTRSVIYRSVPTSFPRPQTLLKFWLDLQSVWISVVAPVAWLFLRDRAIIAVIGFWLPHSILETSLKVTPATSLINYWEQSNANYEMQFSNIRINTNLKENKWPWVFYRKTNKNKAETATLNQCKSWL